MNSMQVMVWFFPMIFIFHDFEEIIFMQSWLRKNSRFLSERFPDLAARLLPHFENITTPVFALGVAEEFVLISIVSVLSYVTNWYSLWSGLFIAFTLHLVIHCLQALFIGKYVPVIITSVTCLPACIFIIAQIMKMTPLNTVVCYSAFSFLIMTINLLAIHKAMPVFGKWLAQYEQQGE